MDKEFVLYEQALALRELGFDEPCICGYSKSNEKLEIYSRFLVTKDSFTVDAPTFSQAFRWFREKHNLREFIGFRPNVKKFAFHIYDMSLSGMEYVKQRTMEEFNKDPKVGTYEEAELGCLIKLIEIVKNK
jgi:hypothetical protein